MLSSGNADEAMPLVVLTMGNVKNQHNIVLFHLSLMFTDRCMHSGRTSIRLLPNKYKSMDTEDDISYICKFGLFSKCINPKEDG